MNWRKRTRREGGYHHGNLKEALLQAALDLIAEKGPAGFTFADAARSAGVSPAAPYRHFRDRDELLASLAQRGFEQFEAALNGAWDDGRPDTPTAFGYGRSSGNRAFDEYRMETLQRLEQEQTEFKEFLERLRHAKDKAEFDQFMSEHRAKPTPPSDQPQG
jgi:AcrR family transcriptional regulator